MTPDELRALTADTVVDARGAACPGPLLAVKKGVVSASAGAIVEILATDIGIKNDLPAWSKKTGHQYLGAVEEPEHLRLFIRKAQ